MNQIPRRQTCQKSRWVNCGKEDRTLSDSSYKGAAKNLLEAPLIKANRLTPRVLRSFLAVQLRRRFHGSRTNRQDEWGGEPCELVMSSLSKFSFGWSESDVACFSFPYFGLYNGSWSNNWAKGQISPHIATRLTRGRTLRTSNNHTYMNEYFAHQLVF